MTKNKKFRIARICIITVLIACLILPLACVALIYALMYELPHLISSFFNAFSTICS
jgi:hypothetical protein